MYCFIATTSFIYTGHCLVQFYVNLTIVALVDLAVVLTLLIYAASIKFIAKKRHNITLACKKVYLIIALICYSLYIAFISGISFTNHIQRQTDKIDFTGAMFYSECLHLLIYITLFGVNRSLEDGHCCHRKFNKKEVDAE